MKKLTNWKDPPVSENFYWSFPWPWRNQCRKVLTSPGWVNPIKSHEQPPFSNGFPMVFSTNQYKWVPTCTVPNFWCHRSWVSVISVGTRSAQFPCPQTSAWARRRQPGRPVAEADEEENGNTACGLNHGKMGKTIGKPLENGDCSWDLMGYIQPGNQTWLAGKWTIEIGDFPIWKLSFTGHLLVNSEFANLNMMMFNRYVI